MRCLALAQTWQKVGLESFFVVSTELGEWQNRLRQEGISIHPLSASAGSSEDRVETIALAKHLGAAWLVVDNYHFDAQYQQQVKAAGLKLLFIDDYGHAEHYYADIVLNQNICADESLYLHRESYTQLLLGCRYVLLRQEFLQWQKWQRKIPGVAKKILVTLGGGDPDNVTFKVIKALQQIELQGLESIVIVGGSNPHYKQLQAAVQKSLAPISLKQNVANMPELMAWADIAIAAGGSTNWELAFMGLPSIIIVLAENQRKIAEELFRLGLAIGLGWHQDVSVEIIKRKLVHLLASLEQRYKMSQKGKDLVDGLGSNRVLRFIQ